MSTREHLIAERGAWIVFFTQSVLSDGFPAFARLVH